MDIDNKIIFLLEKYEQKHLIYDLASLCSNEKKDLLIQLSAIDQYSLSNTPLENCTETFSPLNKCSSITGEDSHLGNKAVKEGRVGIILLAGGEGTRLNFSSPKGMFPISVLKNKSLFQFFCEKIFFAQKKYQKKLYLSVMVNANSQPSIVSFFQEHDFFGLEKNQVDFFCQRTFPFFNEEGKWFWEQKGRIAEGTEGNGGVFAHFYKSPIFQKWKSLQIDTIKILSIDNPLADPFNEKMLGMHKRKNAAVSMCAIPFEIGTKRGGFALVNKTPRILEYLYLEQKNIPISFSNTGIYLVSMDYIHAVFDKSLPLHKISKKTKRWHMGKLTEAFAYKYEKFIFDAFTFTNKIALFEDKKENCFSPLKELKDVEEVKKAMVKKDKKILTKIIGYQVNNEIIELSQAFHHPTKKLLEKWKGSLPIEEGYLDP